VAKRAKSRYSPAKRPTIGVKSTSTDDRHAVRGEHDAVLRELNGRVAREQDAPIAVTVERQMDR